MLFVGDIMLSRAVGDAIAASGDWAWPFERIASVTAGADLAFANLETTISRRGATHGCGFCFRSDPRVVAGLTLAGFDVLSVANNHIGDYGPDAFVDTLAVLASESIAPVGGGVDLTVARTPVVRLVGDTRVAFLAYTNLLPQSSCATDTQPGALCYDAQGMAQDIAAARVVADVVVVSFHTGTEYEHQPNTTQQHIYQEAIDDGADLVVGTHPHVVQPLVRYGRGWIAYSLGNFVFDQNFSYDTTHAMALDVTVQGSHIVSVASESIEISHQYQPTLP